MPKQPFDPHPAGVQMAPLIQYDAGAGDAMIPVVLTAKVTSVERRIVVLLALEGSFVNLTCVWAGPKVFLFAGLMKSFSGQVK